MMTRSFSKLEGCLAALILLCLNVGASKSAYADAYQVFNISATLQSGATVSGTATLDISPPDGNPYFTACNITSTDAAGVTLTSVTYQGGSGEGTWVEDAFSNTSLTAGLTIYIQTTAGSLANYQGGQILTTAYNGQAFSQFYYEDASGNEVADNLVSGSLEPAAPPSTNLSIVSPFLLTSNLANIDLTALLPGIPNLSTVVATGLAADGVSGAIVLFSTTTSGDVTLTSGNGTLLYPYYSNYFPVADIGNVGSKKLVIPSYNLFQIGSLFYAAAILQAPASTAHFSLGGPVQVTAQQNGGSILRESVPLVPAPILLLHGLWGDANSLQSIGTYFSNTTPWSNIPNELYESDYDGTIAFDAPTSLDTVDSEISLALNTAQNNGVVVGRVDVIAHSMGGLLVRDYSGTADYQSLDDREQGRFNTIITLDTPEAGSALAPYLLQHENDTRKATLETDSSAYLEWSALHCTKSDTVATCFGKKGYSVTAGAVGSLVPYSSALMAAPLPYVSNSTWDAVTSTDTTGILRSTLTSLIAATYAVEADAPSLDSIVGAPDDDIVSLGSQTSFYTSFATFSGLAHTDLPLIGKITIGDSVKNSKQVDAQIACWLRNPAAPCVQKTNSERISMTSDDSKSIYPTTPLTIVFPLSASLGENAHINVVSSQPIAQLSVAEHGPYQAGDTDDFEVIENPVIKDGAAIIDYKPKAIGRVDVVVRAEFADGRSGIATGQVSVSSSSTQATRLWIDPNYSERIYLRPGHSLTMRPTLEIPSLGKYKVAIGSSAVFKMTSNDSDPAVTLTNNVLTAKHLGSAVIECSFEKNVDRVEVIVKP